MLRAFPLQRVNPLLTQICAAICWAVFWCLFAFRTLWLVKNGYSFINLNKEKHLMTFNVAKTKVARFVVSTLAVGVVALASASPASAAKIGDSCKLSDAYKIQKVGTSYIRCEIVKGTSLHTSDPKKKAKFKWQKTTERQFTIANANNETVRVDGSSTVYPMSAVAAKYFENSTKSVKKGKGAKVTVGFSGTGGGFEKFCRGETDISNASKAISSSQIAACKANGIEYTEILIANDGLAVVVNKSNTWASCLTMAELKKIWNLGSTVTKWSEVRSTFPDTPLKLFGAGTDSGTFESFTELVNGKGKVVRKDGVQTSEDDNVTVAGVNGDKGAMGYFGLSYAIENESKVKLVQIDKGAGCITPSDSTVQGGTYPLSRPLFTYVKNASISTKPAVGAYIQFWVDNLAQISADAIFVPLTKPQMTKLRNDMVKVAKLPRVKK
jgi:phosphate transport system substrate-binding protein